MDFASVVADGRLARSPASRAGLTDYFPLAGQSPTHTLEFPTKERVMFANTKAFSGFAVDDLGRPERSMRRRSG